MNLSRIGPFYGQKPTTSATTETFGWFMMWIDDAGRIIIKEWIE